MFGAGPVAATLASASVRRRDVRNREDADQELDEVFARFIEK
jgi:hypothetical protein